MTSAEWSETGTDRVQLLVSPNAGEEPKPIEKIASGGELVAYSPGSENLPGRFVQRGACAAVQRTLVFR